MVVQFDVVTLSSVLQARVCHLDADCNASGNQNVEFGGILRRIGQKYNFGHEYNPLHNCGNQELYQATTKLT